MTQMLLQKILAKGFPTQRDEQWKYTNVNHIALRPFKLSRHPRESGDPDIMHNDWIPAFAGMTESDNHIIFINGYITKISLPAEILHTEIIKNHSENLKFNSGYF